MGARVALGARRTELTEKIAGELRDEGREALAVPMDVTSEHSVKDGLQKICNGSGMPALQPMPAKTKQSAIGPKVNSRSEFCTRRSLTCVQKCRGW